jgi:FkbM family methyltransferase
MYLYKVWRHFSHIIYDPKAVAREILGRIRLLAVPATGQVVMNMHGVRFVADLGQDRTFRRMYAGCYQPAILGALQRYLRPGDVFFDIGANVGFISAQAAGLVGREGAVHAFEPVPKYFVKLQSVSVNNPEYRILANQAACGDREGSIEVAVDKDNMGGSSAVPNRVAHIEQRVQVPLISLDRYILDHGLSTITMIKIDVEGFEFFVLSGLRQTLSPNRPGVRPVILCEIVPSAYERERLGFGIQRLQELLQEIAYVPCRLSPVRIGVDLERSGPSAFDVLLLPLKMI